MTDDPNDTTDTSDTSDATDTADPTADLAAPAPEDAKLVTLARATRARVQAGEGAAVRDADGRTYAAATVDLPSLRLSAVQVCVAMAVASGSRGLGAVVVLGETGDLAATDLDAVRDFAGAGVPVLLGDPRGTLTGRRTT